MRFSPFAAMKASAAGRRKSWSIASCSRGWAARRMLRPPGGVAMSGSVSDRRSGAAATVAVDSIVSLTHFIVVHSPAKRDRAKAARP